jgi:hypothetical protein
MTGAHCTDSLLPIIRQMHDAESDRARAGVLLTVPDAVLCKYRSVFDDACRRAGFDLGRKFIEMRRAEWCATRGADGRHQNALFDDVRAEFAAFAAGEAKP